MNKLGLHLIVLAILSVVITLIPQPNKITTTLVLLGGAHIWITPVIYLNKEWRTYLFNDKIRYVHIPILLFLISLSLFTLSDEVTKYISFGLTVVSLWHHGKQNIGILTLVDRHTAWQWKPILLITWVAFIPAWMLQFPTLFVNLESIERFAWIGYLLYCFFIVLFFIRQHSLGYRNLIHWYLYVCLFYFTPLLFLQNTLYVLLLWSGIHTLQYYFLLGRSLSWYGGLNIIILTIVALTIPETPYTVAIIFGVNVVHFYLDAYIWRLSNKKLLELHKLT